ncbi:MAG: hypothetical protein ACK40K_00770 [Raineya sp.]
MFKFLKIDIEQFAVIEKSFDDVQSDVSFGIEISFGLGVNQDVVIVTTKFIFSKEHPFLILQVSCSFEVNSPLIKEQLILDQDTARHLLMLTIGTARGILYAKTEGTKFCSFIIPTLNLYKFITEDVKFDTNYTQ